MTPTRSTTARVCTALIVAAVVAGVPTTADAATRYPSDSAPPDPIPLLAGYSAVWKSSGRNDLHGAVVDAGTLRRDDRLSV